MATNDRLERTASQLEKVVKELEAQENGQNDEMDAEMRSYERKAEQKNHQISRKPSKSARPTLGSNPLKIPKIMQILKLE